MSDKRVYSDKINRQKNVKRETRHDLGWLENIGAASSSNGGWQKRRGWLRSIKWRNRRKRGSSKQAQAWYAQNVAAWQKHQAGRAWLSQT